MWGSPSWIDTSLDARAVTFENPTGARGAGGASHGGRKGAPARVVEAGQAVVLADLEGPGTVRHIWLTVTPMLPQLLRAQRLEVTYDGLDAPSISVPLLDFFGLPHGRPVPYASALTTAQEGRGFNSYVPLPFDRGLRVTLTNEGERPIALFFQLDYTLEPERDPGQGFLHVTWRRENPTVQRRDFVIADGIAGPGRFLGCVVGIRTLDPADWYGEGEVKVYRDGDRDLPTICGTGLEDYVGSAWGLGAHAAPFAGAPLDVRAPDAALPDYVGLYRWHVPDPIVFTSDLRVTVQQIGHREFAEGQDDELERYCRTNPPAGAGLERDPAPGVIARGIFERVDDYCAAAFVYATTPQPVPRYDVAAAVADVARLPYETGR